jgi:hippurate hydrolase
MTEAELLQYHRRQLHTIPELDRDLPQTLAYVESCLAALGDACKVVRPCESTLCALFEHGWRHTTAIRTDMDALPVTERTGAPYASRHEGNMHACGHDGHMAMALVLCRWLAMHAGELRRNVMVLFQPAEETSGGASSVCESGVFERYNVDRIFGFHLWPDIPKGIVASRAGALLSSSNETDVFFEGRASHIAKWQEGRDALRCVTQFVADVYSRIDHMDAAESVLLRFGTLSAGTVRNAIAASAEVHGSLRTFCEGDRAAAKEAVVAAADVAAATFGCKAKTHFSVGNPAVVNDPDLFHIVQEALPDMFEVSEPLLIAEDFAWYQQRLPGVFLLLGTGTGIPLHADTFDFDEAVLEVGLNAYKSLMRA